MKKTDFLGSVRVYEGNATRLIYGFWEWHEEMNAWMCYDSMFADNLCERIY